MKDKVPTELANNLAEFGELIRVARIRRELSAEQIARRAGICRSTVIKIEKGYAGVAIGYYLKVLAVLGLDGNLLSIADNDPVGKALFDAKFTTKSKPIKPALSSNRSGEIKKRMYKIDKKE